MPRSPSTPVTHPLGAAFATLSPDTLAYLLIVAIRYQLPRQTYGSGIVADAARIVWPALSEVDRAVVRRDLAEALTTNRAGAACDRAAWADVLALATEPGVR